jgi:hypothetical protein
VDRRSFPFSTEKAVAIGHGIDVDEFACLERNGAPPAPLRVLALGRYASVKGYEAVLRAIRMVADAGGGVSVRICGPTLTPSERAHRGELERLVAELDLGDVAALTDAVPRSEVPTLLAGADVLVNNTRAGAADKVVYEAAAACVPAIASPPVFDQLLPTSLRFAPDDAAGLADHRPVDGQRAARRQRGVEPDPGGRGGRPPQFLKSDIHARHLQAGRRGSPSVDERQGALLDDHLADGDRRARSARGLGRRRRG